ncbi:uncharacterized protein TNCV_216241 [Trichonephila clavipes]|nr:uncharacterized protein TNCV_216241 [Trichonephila clavipes]
MLCTEKNSIVTSCGYMAYLGVQLWLPDVRFSTGQSSFLHVSPVKRIWLMTAKAVTHHAEAKKHKEWESAAAMSHRMKSFFTPKKAAPKSEENNDIIAAHCNDHIFHNCAKNALKVMPVDVEKIVMKVFAEFSCSAKKREVLKECFDFFESENREVICHVPTRWLKLFKALDRTLSSWGPLKRYFIERGSNNCSTALWAILSDQENEISEEAPNLLKIVQLVCSVPVSNTFVERIFSVMGNVWTDERNSFAVNTVKS